MRRSILLFLAALAACGGADETTPLIADFAARARPLACEAVGLDVEAAVDELRLGSDSTWTLLDAMGRQLLTFDHDYQLLRRIELAETGPGAAQHPVSAVALGDTALAVAARGGLQLVVLDTAGRELGRQQLEFVPNTVAAAADGAVLLTPLPIGPDPSTLLMRYDGRTLEPLDVPTRHFADMSVNALGNSVLVEVLPDGTTLVVHQFYRPRAFRVGRDGTVEELASPVPDAVVDQLAYVPTPPVTEDQLPDIAVPAIAMSVDPRTSEVYVLTRSGTEQDGRQDRAVLRLTDHLDFLDGFTLPVHAIAMVYLPARHALLVADDENAFHECPIPTAESPA